MSPLEQQALVARQLGALLRHGRSWGDALTLVAPGLPAGPVSAWVDERRREAAAGREGTEPSAAALEAEALAIEARLEAQAALRLARVFSSLSLGGALLLGSAMAWLVPSIMGAESAQVRSGLMVLVEAFRFLGPPSGLICLVLPWRLATTSVPGAREFELAAKLADVGRPCSTDPLDLPLDANERTWLSSRRHQVGQEAAALELAAELSAEGRSRVRLLRQLGPMVGLGLGVLGLVPWVVVLVEASWQQFRFLGAGP